MRDYQLIDLLSEAEERKLDGEHEQALQLLDQILLDDPANVTALEEVAENELSLRHFDRAERAAEAALRLDVTSFLAYYVLGSVSAARGKHRDAINAFKEANLLQPNSPEILRALGRALLADNKLVEGLVTLERALNLDPDNSATLADLAIARLLNGDAAGATSLAEEALARDPKSEDAAQCLQSIRMYKKKIDL